MRVPACVLSLMTLAAARTTLFERTLVADGGWSLSLPAGSTCPDQTATCFSKLTGVSEIFDRTGVPGTFDRGQECCPSGTTPRLDCGTYVNNGQPYACCPLDNADCRGDVEDPSRKGNEKCANSGWALWQIPDGDYNMFCCLPGWYGYWNSDLGQDAVGQCQILQDLPAGSTPAIQFNNGDGSVNSAGTQVSALPVATPTPAPTCDILHYGWSLQVDDASECTEGSSLCSYGGACCPSGLNCGTVIGPSEVPVCCPPGNSDCRGDVEGLWPQVCADSSWSLWHVNTNGNHFCCLPGQIGYNVPSDNAAVGFCGSAVPNGTMRSILDYVGDGSTAGSFASFPCDSNPAPNATWSNITSSILNPGSTLNPTGLPLATGLWSNGTSYLATKTLVKPWEATSYVCPAGSSQTLAIIHSLSNGIPVTSTSTVGAASYTATPTVVNVISKATVNGVVQTMTSTSSVSGAASGNSGSSANSGSSGNSGSGGNSGSSANSGLSGNSGSGTNSGSSGSSGSGGNSGSSAKSGSSGSSGSSVTSSPSTFTGGASNLGSSLAAVGIGAVAAVLLWSW